MPELLVLKINKELQNIKARYQKKYSAVFFDIKVKNINDNIILEGIVLSEKQKNEVFLAVKDIIKDNRVEDRIKVLSDPEDRLEVGWGAVNTEVANIWTKFPGKKKPAGLASQALKSDFVRVLAEKGDWSLIQTADLAIGWIDSSLIIISKWGVVKKEWLKTKRINSGEMFKKRLAKNIQKKFLDFLKKYLGVSYLLGGMTEKGVDCSGLTQRFYLDIFGITLPRHSSDQALCGEKIELKASHFGDLVYLRHKITKFAHIGVVVEKFETSKSKRQNFDNILILNARLEKGVAAIEDLPEILKSYNLISVKRIIKEL